MLNEFSIKEMGHAAADKISLEIGSKDMVMRIGIKNYWPFSAIL